jgi:hypothetical protein
MDVIPVHPDTGQQAMGAASTLAFQPTCGVYPGRAEQCPGRGAVVRELVPGHAWRRCRRPRRASPCRSSCLLAPRPSRSCSRRGRQLIRARAGLRRTAVGAGTLHRCGEIGHSGTGLPGDYPIRTAPARPVRVLDRHLPIRLLGCVADGGHRQRCDRIYQRGGRVGFPGIRAPDGGGRHFRAAGPRRYRGPGPDGGR